MGFEEEKNYQRKFLRAPYKQEVLYVDTDHVFKAQTLNISEGGILLDKIGHFPEENNMISFMMYLPYFPKFKDFTLEKLKSFNPETAGGEIIRCHASIARKNYLDSKVDGLFQSQIGLEISKISKQYQNVIANYVEVFSSNVIYLLVLFDTINNDKNNLDRIRYIAEYLGYGKNKKLSVLRRLVEHDYQSLQWL